MLLLQDKVLKSLETEGVEAAYNLVRDGKEHDPSNLIKRLIGKKQPKPKSLATRSRTYSVPNDYVSDLTTKIMAQL